MRIKEVKLYKFDECPDDLKKKILTNYRYINVEDHGWWEQDGLLDLNQEECNALPATARTTYESKGGCMISYAFESFDLDRNRHLCFKCVAVNLPTVFEAWLGLDKLPDNILKDVWYEFTSPRNANTQLIVHFEGEDVELERCRGATIIENAEEKFDRKVKEALSILEHDYEWLQNDDQVIETLEANEYEFDEETGKISR